MKSSEVVVEDKKLFYNNSGEMLQASSMEDSDSKWILVLSTSTVLYIGEKNGPFQHSSFFAGGATGAA
ncbi:hypothetical protein Bca52824_001364 [Brassica carinata]|uniref:Uncharacterized protein n=1 Tax=Brassica carinata TaxID=52824 RepID=A0A8X7WI69_BRACI|nr:hypothetical protein Bca52824_001364 [Brassica carinata]